jgi:hypothetical protein
MIDEDKKVPLKIVNELLAEKTIKAIEELENLVKTSEKISKESSVDLDYKK